ncbi:MAG: SAM-dependent methyltransferase [Rhizobacter sp.]|nr:SAM-dependent methyltransferase [Burkholderiales bacterium]
MIGTLYLLPNLLGVAAPSDVLPARSIALAQTLNHFIVETPKVARAFLKTLSPERVIADIFITACDPLPAAKAQCAAWLKAGIDVGVISDAGCPGMADPGAAFVALAHTTAIAARVVPLVGPSSVLLGLMASGFDGQHFAFHGYLPSKPLERDAALRALDRQVQSTGSTQIFIETPYRNAAMLGALRDVVAASTHVCIAQNLGAEGETICAKAASAWSETDRNRFVVKAPTLFLLGKPQG